jgi:hypothetical protein
MGQLNTIFELEMLNIRLIIQPKTFRALFAKSSEQIATKLTDIYHELFIHTKLYTTRRGLSGLFCKNCICRNSSESFDTDS